MTEQWQQSAPTREGQQSDVTALAAWLLTLTPEQYADRLATLGGWCDVLDDQLGQIDPDADPVYAALPGMASIVAALSAPDTTD